MTPPLLATIFMSCWLGIIGIAGIAMLFQNLGKQPFDASLLIPAGMFLFGYGISFGGFKFESIKARAKLLELLEGELEVK
jgi:hypothetical protein